MSPMSARSNPFSKKSEVKSQASKNEDLDSKFNKFSV